ncbi:MAG: aldehyde ferredoxin oxidoreductase family protein [Planctomycetes bacterium]|nr:aldehyde ferredoxin oxidoreductase family protein [Planctomycetota bacterium]
MFAYGGNILRINLTTGKYALEPVSEKLAREYLGGRGFTAKILYDELKRGIDPLGPENKVVMASGPLAGLCIPAGGKTTFASKSPATGGYGDSNVGGHLASELKYAGYDAIIIEGASPKPVFIYILNDMIEIRDASELWGKGALTAEKILKDKLGDDFQIAIIGPAGENLVKFACVSHDFGRQAGRTGIGAVMGSKKLKAIAIKGTKSIKVKDPKALYEIGKASFQECFKHPSLKIWQDQGTSSVVDWSNKMGSFPTRNFKTGYFAEHKNINGDTMQEKTIVTNKACFGCPMACGKYAKTHQNNKTYYVEGPEYETAAMIGGDCAITDIFDLSYANWVCDELGLDTISGGNVIAFAIECFEKGIITEKDTNGLKLRFGDIKVFEELAYHIAYRRGIGDILANGARYAAEKFNSDALKIAMQVKGLEISGYESRNAPAMLLAYMTCDIGAHHNRAWAITHDIAAGRDKIEGKAKKVIELQHIRPMFDMLAVCRLPWVELELNLEQYAKFLSIATGENYMLSELLEKSERVWNLTRSFFIREIEGFGRKDDMPPARIYEEAVPDGPTKDQFMTKAKVEQLLDDYYELRGWNKNGIPTEATLRRLKLDRAADELKALGKL